MPYSDKKVWLVTGAGRGMGVDIAKAALAAGNAVVATGRRPEAVEQDVTSPAEAEAAVQAAVERFDRIAAPVPLCATIPSRAGILHPDLGPTFPRACSKVERVEEHACRRARRPASFSRVRNIWSDWRKRPRRVEVDHRGYASSANRRACEGM
jgi:hypothetical protein